MRIQSPFQFPKDHNEAKRNCAAKDHSLTIQNHFAQQERKETVPAHRHKILQKRTQQEKIAISTEKEPPCQVMSEPSDEDGDARVLCKVSVWICEDGKMSRCLQEDGPESKKDRYIATASISPPPVHEKRNPFA